MTTTNPTKLTDTEIRQLLIRANCPMVKGDVREYLVQITERAVLDKLRQGGEPAADERTEFVAWLTSTYPDAYSEPEAVRLWHHEHVAALAWEERGRRAVLADRQQRAAIAAQQSQGA